MALTVSAFDATAEVAAQGFFTSVSPFQTDNSDPYCKPLLPGFN
jgi:hypothetical protein